MPSRNTFYLIFLSFSLLMQLLGFQDVHAAAGKPTPPLNLLEKIEVDYSAGKTNMRGYVSYKVRSENEDSTKKPGILIVHDWMGLSDFQKSKADQMAQEGFVALAVDIYGTGVRPKNVDEAGKLATKYKSDVKLLRSHIRAAYDKLAAMPNVDPNKIIVMGYCFGGTTALELARSGVTLAGTASFHGGLATPKAADAKKIKGKVLAMHGAIDPYVPASEVAAFKKEMSDAKVDFKFIEYPGAVHAFTNPMAGDDIKKGAAYDAEADRKSWIDFMAFVKDVVHL